MRLNDPWFQATFVRTNPDGVSRQHGVPYANADGVYLCCPCGRHEDEVRVSKGLIPRFPLRGGTRPHGLFVHFANPMRAPRPPEATLTHRGEDGQTRHVEIVSGTGLSDLTLAEPVNCHTGHWRGTIINGVIETLSAKKEST